MAREFQATDLIGADKLLQQQRSNRDQRRCFESLRMRTGSGMTVVKLSCVLLTGVPG